MKNQLKLEQKQLLLGLIKDFLEKRDFEIVKNQLADLILEIFPNSKQAEVWVARIKGNERRKPIKALRTVLRQILSFNIFKREKADFKRRCSRLPKDVKPLFMKLVYEESKGLRDTLLKEKLIN